MKAGLAFFSTYYNNHVNILFWAILSYVSIDCAKTIMVNYGLLSYRFIAAVYIIESVGYNLVAASNNRGGQICDRRLQILNHP